MEKNLQPVIEYVLVIPRTVRYVNYLINDSPEMHSKKNNDMYSFLVNLVPSKAKEIKHLLSIFHSMIVKVTTEEIQELVFSYTDHAEELRRKVRQFNPEVALMSLRYHNANRDDKIMGISKQTGVYDDIINFYHTQISNAKKDSDSEKRKSDADKNFIGKIIGR